jgi:hypothetical protein
MKLSKLEKIDIIKTVIEIWGSITDNLFRNHVPIKLKQQGNDKYNITQYIEKYDVDNVTVTNYSDGNILGQEKIPYEKLPSEIIDMILPKMIDYDTKMMKRK